MRWIAAVPILLAIALSTTVPVHAAENQVELTVAESIDAGAPAPQTAVAPMYISSTEATTFQGLDD